MTKIAVAGPASGTGTFTLTTPVSSSDRTLTFPDSTGTVLNDQSDIEAQVKTATNASGDAPIYSCRAWCNFDGTTSPGTIRASGNVSSVTRTGTGQYTANLSTAMPDNFYAAFVNTSDWTGDANYGTQTPTTTSILIRTRSTTSYVNFTHVYLSIFR
jgi:hypothetical protein